jgi:hypothetical protein
LIAVIAVSMVPLPVMMMTSGGVGSSRIWRSTSSPSTSGMTMSRRATSNASARSAASAARPSRVVVTW